MNFDIAKHNTFTSDYILKFQPPWIAKGGNSVPGVYCNNKTHCCHLEFVNQFAIVFLSEVFPAVTENRQDRGTDRTLTEPHDRHTYLLSVNIVTVQFTGSCSSEIKALFIHSSISQVQETLFISACTDATKNFFHVS